eukprot:CAMPEP_0181218482 /NCGR_PEP_ID=MMETSP1096-20121128/27719_1 /TAXON_ID=156174 ORGANISM="Chrysochromulina ericina, Strain CCMP281" /NCGR_SAMPLE_ID=MMETSP1096 /ASSEMBLY_ACC=CAM_ASM_000453 /LENGTH=133 /DNA_ID=CAMNT_0023310705 /DNA_START=417 /DNA_END=818 /DNA_ORIENTATION=-
MDAAAVPEHQVSRFAADQLAAAHGRVDRRLRHSDIILIVHGCVAHQVGVDLVRARDDAQAASRRRGIVQCDKALDRMQTRLLPALVHMPPAAVGSMGATMARWTKDVAAIEGRDQVGSAPNMLEGAANHRQRA